MTLLVFEVDRLRLAIPAQSVEQVHAAVAIAALPKAPPIVEGVVNVRGSLVPVLDLRRRFGLVPVALAPEQHLILARCGPRVVALRVDRASAVAAVPRDAVESAERIVPGAEYLAGIAKLPDGLLVIQDLERFLSLDEGQKVDVALAEAARSGV